MKQIGAWLLVLFLFCGFSASAETLTVPVWIGNTEVQLSMERYENDLGVSMAYDPANFLIDTENPDMLRFAQPTMAFLCFQSLDGMTVEEATDGLTLQAKSDECSTNDAVIGGMFADEIPVMAVFDEEAVEDETYQHTYYLVDRGASTLMVECYYPTEIDTVVGAELTVMLQSITLENVATPTVTAAPQASSKLVQCEICGGWFKPGNEFRNHQCIGYPAEDDDMVQCEICGGWFKAGNEFRNHQCIGYPAADDEQVETYPSEDNQVETYPSEDNETYPQE